MAFSIFHRLIRAITLTLLACFTSAGYFALRALAWHRSGDDIGRAAVTGAVSALVIVGGLMLFYTLVGAFGLRRRVDWVSLQLGALVGALLYGAYSAVTMPIGAALHPTERALQGAIDGLLVGAAIGLLVMLVNRRPVQLSITGLMRFVSLFIVMLLLLWGAVMLAQFLRHDAAYLLLIPALLILRVILGLVDARNIPADVIEESYDHENVSYDHDLSFDGEYDEYANYSDDA